MTALTQASFTTQARHEGFDEIVVREWEANLKLDTHTHPFDVSAHVVRDEYWLTVGEEVQHLKAGDFFGSSATCRMPNFTDRKVPPSGWRAPTEALLHNAHSLADLR